MSITNEILHTDCPSWQEECHSLLTQPLKAGESINREGRTLGLRVTSLPGTEKAEVDLAISLFFLSLSPPQEDEREMDQAALSVFLEGVQHSDFRIRLAACEALGQLGNPSGRAALETALRDESPYVCTAAARALSMMDVPRHPTTELAGVRLLLWQQVKHLWTPLKTGQTDRRGRVQFARIPCDAICRLQLLAQENLAGSISVKQSGPGVEAADRLAAAGSMGKSLILPPSQRLALKNGSLLCTVYRNDQEQVVVEFRSDAEQLRNGWVHFTVTHAKTGATIVEHSLPLEPNKRNVLTASFLLSNVVTFSQEHQIRFEALLPPTEAE